MLAMLPIETFDTWTPRPATSVRFQQARWLLSRVQAAVKSPEISRTAR
jgi:hypothetical protein